MVIDLITEMNHIAVGDNSFLIVKIGDDNRPATLQDIKDVKDELARCLSPRFPDLPVIVTHHNIEFKLYTCNKGE